MTQTRARPLQVGVVLPHWEALPPDLPYWMATELPGPVARWNDMLALALQAEAAGVDSLWVVDHFLIEPLTFDQPDDDEQAALLAGTATGVWECWSLLAALAATTTRVALGTLVTCTNYRNPALLAKIADTVDEISGGRLILGLGAGDYAEEHARFGARWDKRVGRFEEALQIIVPLLRTGAVDFVGEHFQARECALRPRGPRPQGPQILIGALAHGPRVLRLCARYADIWNGWMAHHRSHPDVVPPLRDAVDAACLAIGRAPTSLHRSLTVGVAFGHRAIPTTEPVTGSVEEIAETLRAFAREGIGHVQLWLNPMTSEGIARVAEVLAILDQS